MPPRIPSSTKPSLKQSQTQIQVQSQFQRDSQIPIISPNERTEQSQWSIWASPPLAKDLDLDLSSKWYMRQPLVLPPQISSGSHTYSISSSGFRGNMETILVIATQYDDLSRSSFRISWTEKTPEAILKQRHTAPPPRLGVEELKVSSNQYGPRVVNFCIVNWGKKVGNGECWTLAEQGVSSIPGCLPSQGLIHGHPIYSSKTSTAYEAIRPGDIVQFRSAKFQSRTATSWAGMPDHTSVILEQLLDGRLKVAEQNVGGKKVVMEGVYKLSDLVEGDVNIFRPIRRSWLGELDAAWHDF